jgi:hypothetical protein
VLVVCWSVKGGAGTTVVAVGAALAAAATRPTLLVDLAGDVGDGLGLAPGTGPGVAEWLAAGPGAPPDALVRLEVPVVPGLTLVHRGAGPLVPDRAALLVQVLAAGGRTVVVDAGVAGRCRVARCLAARADRSLLVTRLCALALRRVDQAPVRPSGVVVVREAGRLLSLDDVKAAVGSPVVAEVAVDPAVARAVDLGLARGRLPRSFAAAVAAVTS